MIRTPAMGALADGRATPVVGTVRVDGVPVHLSETDWVITAGRTRTRRTQRLRVRRDPWLWRGELRPEKDGVI